MVFASALIEDDGIFGDVKGAVSKAVLHVNEYICQITATDNDALGFVGALAAGILTHINLGLLGCRAVKLNGAVDRCDRGGINGGRCGRRLGWLLGHIVGLLSILFLAACG